MLVDMYYNTRDKARDMNKTCESEWKYLGTAKDGKFGYVAWRTNTKKHVQRLLTNDGVFYEKYTNVIIDKGAEDFN